MTRTMKRANKRLALFWGVAAAGVLLWVAVAYAGVLG